MTVGKLLRPVSGTSLCGALAQMDVMNDNNNDNHDDNDSSMNDIPVSPGEIWTPIG